MCRPTEEQTASKMVKNISYQLIITVNMKVAIEFLPFALG